MALSDCTECWSTPCECGHEFKGVSQEYREKMTKSVNGFTIQDVFHWLSKKLSNRRLGMIGLTAMALFMVLLFAGYIYVLKKGALEWQ